MQGQNNQRVDLPQNLRPLPLVTSIDSGMGWRVPGIPLSRFQLLRIIFDIGRRGKKYNDIGNNYSYHAGNIVFFLCWGWNPGPWGC